MDSSFDLNIQNYTIKELEDIFELSHSYDENIVEMQETKLRQNILNDKNTVSTTKPNVLSFLTQIKSILVDNINVIDVPLTLNDVLQEKKRKLELTDKEVIRFVRSLLPHYKKLHKSVKDKKLKLREVPIVVYCYYHKCNASEILMEHLQEIGFKNVREYK